MPILQQVVLLTLQKKLTVCVIMNRNAHFISVTLQEERALLWPLFNTVIYWGGKEVFQDFLRVKDVCSLQNLERLCSNI